MNYSCNFQKQINRLTIPTLYGLILSSKKETVQFRSIHFSIHSIYLFTFIVISSMNYLFKNIIFRSSTNFLLSFSIIALLNTTFSVTNFILLSLINCNIIVFN